MQKPLYYLRVPSQFPADGEERTHFSDIEIFVLNVFERHAPPDKMYLKMKLVHVNNNHCHMYDYDDRLCFGVNMEHYYLTWVIISFHTFG